MMGNYPASSSTLSGHSERGLCNPSALLLWANALLLLLSAIGAESLLPVNAPSVSVISHSEIPPDSLS